MGSSRSMKAVEIAVKALRLDPENVRVHDARNRKAIADSLEKFGQQRPIVVDGENTVLAGNGTVLAAQALGWTKIKAVRTELTGAAARAYALADNRAAELATWDFEHLGPDLLELRSDGVDLDALGWTEDELATMSPRSEDWTPPTEPDRPGSPGTDKQIRFAPEQWAKVAALVERMRSEPKADSDRTAAACLAELCRRFKRTVNGRRWSSIVKKSQTEEDAK